MCDLKIFCIFVRLYLKLCDEDFAGTVIMALRDCIVHSP